MTKLKKKKFLDFHEISVNVNQAKIFCRIIGKGQPLIVLHGGPGLTQDYLLPKMAKLSEDNLVIFYDQRGCGRSTGAINKNSININSYINDLDEIRKYFGFKKFSILGHSWGGFIAMQYVIKYDKFVDKLILSNTVPASSEERSLFIENKQKILDLQRLEKIKKTKGFSLGKQSSVVRYYKLLFSYYFYNPEKVDLLNFKMSAHAFLNGLKIYDIFQDDFFSKPYNLHKSLKKLNISTLIIHADADPIPISAIENIHKSIRNSKYILMKKCGHFPYIECPKIFFKYLKYFLKANIFNTWN